MAVVEAVVAIGTASKKAAEVGITALLLLRLSPFDSQQDTTKQRHKGVGLLDNVASDHVAIDEIPAPDVKKRFFWTW